MWPFQSLMELNFLLCVDQMSESTFGALVCFARLHSAGCSLIWLRVNRLLRLMKSLSCQSAAERRVLMLLKSAVAEMCLSPGSLPSLLFSSPLCQQAGIFLIQPAVKPPSSSSFFVSEWINQKLKCLRLVMSGSHFIFNPRNRLAVAD